MSNDEVGLVLVGLTVFFAVLGYLLSTKGLKQVSAAATETQAVAKEAQTAIADVQLSIAQETGTPAAELAQSSTAVAKSTGAIHDQLAGVNTALEGLTGNQAPARVAWALCALCLVSAFVAFDLISVAVTPEAKAPGS